MTRPTYETESDRQAEQAIAETVARAWRCALYKLPISYGFDFAVIRGHKPEKVVAFVEVKRRHHSFGIYDDIMLSALKLMKAKQVGVPVYFVVQWDDKTGYCELTDDLWESLAWGGRTSKTRDAADIEPVVHIPMARFKIIARTEEKVDTETGEVTEESAPVDASFGWEVK